MGEQVRDYLHVADVAAALWAVAGSELTGVVNVGSGLPATNREIVLEIGGIVGRPELVRLGDLPVPRGRSGVRLRRRPAPAESHRLGAALRHRERLAADRGLVAREPECQSIVAGRLRSTPAVP